jgi:hypothetical protein
MHIRTSTAHRACSFLDDTSTGSGGGRQDPADCSGEWDYLGSSTFYSVNGYYYSYTVNSGGGDFKICVMTGSGSDHLYGLFEYDPDDEGLNSDEKIGSSKPLSNGDCATWSVGAYVDGSNNRAEIYVATQDSKVQSVKYWD